jgi:hypothetical protein
MKDDDDPSYKPRKPVGCSVHRGRSCLEDSIDHRLHCLGIEAAHRVRKKLKAQDARLKGLDLMPRSWTPRKGTQAVPDRPGEETPGPAPEAPRPVKKVRFALDPDSFPAGELSNSLYYADPIICDVRRALQHGAAEAKRMARRDVDTEARIKMYALLGYDEDELRSRKKGNLARKRLPDGPTKRKRRDKKDGQKTPETSPEPIKLETTAVKERKQILKLPNRPKDQSYEEGQEAKEEETAEPRQKKVKIDLTGPMESTIKKNGDAGPNERDGVEAPTTANVSDESHNGAISGNVLHEREMDPSQTSGQQLEMSVLVVASAENTTV